MEVEVVILDILDMSEDPEGLRHERDGLCHETHLRCGVAKMFSMNCPM